MIKAISYLLFYITLLIFLYLFFTPPKIAFTTSNLTILMSNNEYKNYTAISSVSLSLLLLFGAIAYLARRYNGKKIVKILGLKEFKFSHIAIGILLFFVIFSMEIAIIIISVISNVEINTNANIIVENMPLWFILFTSFIAPIDEEVFFRGFLITRIEAWYKNRNSKRATLYAIVISAFIFSLFHLSYDSTFEIEVIAAFIFGLLAGYVFKKTNSLYPSIIAHMLVNLLAVIAITGFI